MATSGQWAFDLEADALLDEAWERCGQDPRLMTERQAASALRSMQLLLVAWTNRGLNLWQVDRQTTSVGAGQSIVTTPAGTTDILESYVTLNGQDRMLAQIGRDAWMALPNKQEAGDPTMVWCERINAVPVLHLYPVPTAPVSLTYSRIRLPQDVSALTQTLDAPALWFDALAAELAARLAGKFVPARLADLRDEAAKAFAEAAEENRERVPASFVPVLW